MIQNISDQNMILQILGWPKSLFGYFRELLQKNLNEFAVHLKLTQHYNSNILQ